MPNLRVLLRAGALALLVPLLAIGLVAGPAGSVAVRQVWKLPASGTFTLNGHGFGHGHGMSQYGAQGAALRGLTARQILGFYYPGTTLSSYAGNIAVLITADTTRDVVVRTQPGLSVRDLGSGTAYPLSMAGVSRWRLNVDGTSAVVAYYTDGWHRYHLPGGLAHLVGDGMFSATSGQLTLVTPYGDRVYRGSLRAASPAPGSADRDTVNVLSLEQYVQGVVPAEMPASWQPAAVQAQAVAARTYALWSRAANLHRYYQICDTTSCQVYKGVAGEDPRGNAAVTATKGQYLTYQGQPAFTQFSASSGGWTSAGSVPYLPHQSDPYDGWSGNGVHSWSVKVSESVLEHRYPQVGELNQIVVTRREGGGDWQGRVWTVELHGSKGTVTISGDAFRAAYGLRSSWFNLG